MLKCNNSFSANQVQLLMLKRFILEKSSYTVPHYPRCIHLVLNLKDSAGQTLVWCPGGPFTNVLKSPEPQSPLLIFSKNGQSPRNYLTLSLGRVWYSPTFGLSRWEVHPETTVVSSTAMQASKPVVYFNLMINEVRPGPQNSLVSKWFSEGQERGGNYAMTCLVPLMVDTNFALGLGSGLC